MKPKKGHRGYIGSRPYHSGDYPQHVQNIIIRNYCQKNQLTYLLSATEYAMPGCYMMLEEVLRSLDTLEGIVLFSIFMLPKSAQKRKAIYDEILKGGTSLHAALEDLSIHSEADIQVVEDMMNLNNIINHQSLVELRSLS
ncbi:MAG: sporadic carbohydrate cluster protein, TIGR04323 family [Gammaproteobacteria bacterium]|nr:MAG: sporadic carbohydrate cluster protein, TIGR04323 family [Gammaproteobacteria bacterium]